MKLIEACVCGYDYNDAEWTYTNYTSKIITARSWHNCIECGAVIRQGDKCELLTCYNIEGNLNRRSMKIYTCMFCYKAICDFQQDGCRCLGGFWNSFYHTTGMNEREVFG